MLVFGLSAAAVGVRRMEEFRRRPVDRGFNGRGRARLRLRHGPDLYSSGRSGLEFGADDGRFFLHGLHPGLDDFGLLRLGNPESFDRRPSGFGGLLRTVALVILAAAVPATYLSAPRFGLWAPKAAPLGFRPDPSWPAVFAVRMILLSAAAFLWLAAILWPSAFSVLGGAALLAALASEIVGRLQFYALPLGL